jgi:multidrug transporter EmrE-like cation transporter
MSHWIALFLAILGNVGANIAFKKFVTTTEFGWSWPLVRAALLQPTLWVGFSFGLALLGCYLYAIRGLPLGAAYTLATSLSIVGMTCVSVFLFGEALGVRAIFGIVVVLVGVALITTGNV